MTFEALGYDSSLSLPLNCFKSAFGSSYLNIPFKFLVYSLILIGFIVGVVVSIHDFLTLKLSNIPVMADSST